VLEIHTFACYAEKNGQTQQQLRKQMQREGEKKKKRCLGCRKCTIEMKKEQKKEKG